MGVGIAESFLAMALDSNEGVVRSAEALRLGLITLLRFSATVIKNCRQPIGRMAIAVTKSIGLSLS